MPFSTARPPPGHRRTVCHPANHPQVVLAGPFSASDPANSWLPELEDDVQAFWCALVTNANSVCVANANSASTCLCQVACHVLGTFKRITPMHAAQIHNPHRSDETAMASVAEALRLYRGSRQCLIHNDLHAGGLAAGGGRAAPALLRLNCEAAGSCFKHTRLQTHSSMLTN